MREEVKDAIALKTVAEMLPVSRQERLTRAELERRAAQVAANNGATGELLLELSRLVPEFCMALRKADMRPDAAFVSLLQKPQYRIWTGGGHGIVKSISEYEKKKENYLFWIDRNEKTHKSVKCPGARIGERATDLLVYLVERLGQRVPPEQVLRDVWGIDQKGEGFEQKIEQQLTLLQKFSGRQFRSHLFPGKFNKGLGLRHSFRDKYFIFTQLR